MEIDINIRNATPEEAQRVLIGMSFAEDILGKISPAIKIEKAEKPPVICDGCHPKPCSGCRFEREQCKHRPFAKGDHICRYFTVPVPDPTCEKCSPPPAPKKTRAKVPMKPGQHNGNQFGIPSDLYATDKRLYQRLWARCKKHGIKYEAALEMEGKTKRGKPRLPLKMKNKEPESPVVIRYTGLDHDLNDALPEERPPTGPQEKREAEKTMDAIKIGDKVRQIGGLKICTGIGEIKRAVPGSPEVLVAFANGQEWISSRNLAPVMA